MNNKCCTYRKISFLAPMGSSLEMERATISQIKFYLYPVPKVIALKLQTEWSIRTKGVSTDVQHQHDNDEGKILKKKNESIWCVLKSGKSELIINGSNDKFIPMFIEYRFPHVFRSHILRKLPVSCCYYDTVYCQY